MWHFLFPAGSRPGTPDETFAAQHAALIRAGYGTSLVSDRVLAGVEPLRGLPTGRTVVYRGWMATEGEYGSLIRAVESAGCVPLTDTTAYLAAHHLPNWYPLLTEFTAETRVFAPDVDLVTGLRSLGWGAYFLKDFVKSLKTGRGSVVCDPAEAPAVVEELRESRGRIEGGICVRRVEDYVAGTEQRYFVLRGVGYSATDAEVPDCVLACAARVQSPYFSVDVAHRRDGVLRVVEVGDGQVSDLVGWPMEAFAAMWKSA